VTRPLRLSVTCERGHLIISGLVERDEQRLAAFDIVRAIPGVTGAVNEIVANPRVRPVGV
jgi:osmotically-inducible protein OsmY